MTSLYIVGLLADFTVAFKVASQAGLAMLMRNTSMIGWLQCALASRVRNRLSLLSPALPQLAGKMPAAHGNHRCPCLVTCKAGYCSPRFTININNCRLQLYCQRHRYHWISRNIDSSSIHTATTQTPYRISSLSTLPSHHPRPSNRTRPSQPRRSLAAMRACTWLPFIFLASPFTLATPVLDKSTRHATTDADGLKHTTFYYPPTDSKLDYKTNSSVCETTPGVGQHSGYATVGEDMHMFFWHFQVSGVYCGFSGARMLTCAGEKESGDRAAGVVPERRAWRS